MEKNWGALRCARWASWVCILVLVPTFLSPHFSLDPRLHARLLACLLLCLQGCAFEGGGGVDPEDLRADCGIQARHRHHGWVRLASSALLWPPPCLPWVAALPCSLLRGGRGAAGAPLLPRLWVLELVVSLISRIARLPWFYLLVYLLTCSLVYLHAYSVCLPACLQRRV